MPENLLRQPNFAVLVALTWLLVALVLLLQYWDQTGATLLDTDDAMRLVQMRDWLAGQGWFDLHQARIQPPLGYVSHWSRLVDAGLAGLFLILRLGVDPIMAERLMRAWWPLLWLLPTMAGTAAVAWRIAGREGATVALLMGLVGVPAYQQFTPGRVDHHNIMIALTVLAVAAALWSDRKRWAAAAAGAISGLAPAIGFECLPYLMVCGGALALRHVFDRGAGAALRDYGLALAAALAIGFAADVEPGRWMISQCDAMAINGLAAGVGAGLVLALVGQLNHPQALTRGFAVAAAGSLALAIYLLLQPRCIGGPFAMVDPAIWPIWHSQVRELQPLSSVFRVNPLTAAGIAAFPLAATLAALVLGTQETLRRDFGYLTAAAAFLAAAGVTVMAIRGYSYAMWLGMPLVAAAALRLFVTLKLKTMVAQLTAALLLTPMVVSAGAITIAHATGFNDADSFARPASRHCFASASYAALARLPAGLVAADVSFGPFLLALTLHSVMSAPYHRLGNGIVVAHQALASPPDAARGILAGAKVNYVMLCGPRPPDGLAEPARGQSLWGRLHAGAIPAWLEAVPGTEPFAVYRVRP